MGFFLSGLGGDRGQEGSEGAIRSAVEGLSRVQLGMPLRGLLQVLLWYDLEYH